MSTKKFAVLFSKVPPNCMLNGLVSSWKFSISALSALTGNLGESYQTSIVQGCGPRLWCVSGSLYTKEPASNVSTLFMPRKNFFHLPEFLGTKMQAEITSGDCFFSLAYFFKKFASP